MSDNAKRMTVQLESTFPPDPALDHYCRGDEALLLIARISTWADDYRYTAEGKNTANWHFLDVPLGQSVGDGLGYCQQGCITQAIAGQEHSSLARSSQRYGRERPRLALCRALPGRHAPAPAYVGQQ